jgi:hypothetical protein
MNMTGFASSCTATTPDPAKRVKYTLGIVLNIENLEQQDTYYDTHLH